MPSSVLIIGGRGEFGQFLTSDILPGLGVPEATIISIGRETPREEYFTQLQRAQHVILATPLAGYAERACELVYQCRDVTQPVTLWLIPSVQAGVWRAVTATLQIVANPQLSAVFVHPMYGPNGFRATEVEARTFQNILTATVSGAAHPIDDEVAAISQQFVETFNISTMTGVNPEEHDRITAYSQGLSYCVGRAMFESPTLDAAVADAMPDLHHAFHANHDLILDFLRINAYMPQVLAAFDMAFRQTQRATVDDLLTAFATADAALNRGVDSPIPTKWYEKLRVASHVRPAGLAGAGVN